MGTDTFNSKQLAVAVTAEISTHGINWDSVINMEKPLIARISTQK
jgi:hypothetical protein